MKDELTFEKAVELNLNMIGVIKYYWPFLADHEADFIIWEKTCYPMDTDTAFKQIFELYKSAEIQGFSLGGE